MKSIANSSSADELVMLLEERKLQYPQNMDRDKSPTDEKATLDVSMAGTDDGKDDSDAASDAAEERSSDTRTLRTKTGAKRKAEAEKAQKEKAKKAKIEAAKSETQRKWEALLAAIEKKKEELKFCEDNINELDDDLRETLVARSKVVGKDRFMNKYYWFEHNGMPFSGVPASSTAEYGYANGRLWVQGPDKDEFQCNLEEPWLSRDLSVNGITVPQRKEVEEGPTHLSTSEEWGYYDDPDDLDKLLDWLDDRGVREKALRKELLLFKDRIAHYMGVMKAHLIERELPPSEDEEDAPPVSRRTRTSVSVDQDVTKPRCLKWTNSIKRGEEDAPWNHSEEYDVKAELKADKKNKRGTAKVVKGGKKKSS